MLNHKGGSPFDLKNRADIVNIRIDNGILNNLLQGISEDIFALNQLLENKQNTISGFTGTISIITDIDFASETTINKNINISNGIIESITDV